MFCRICGKSIHDTGFMVKNIGDDIRSLYKSKRKITSKSGIMFYCSDCRHWQLESDISQEEYMDYNLFNIEGKPERSGGLTPRREKYYKDVLEKLRKISGDNIGSRLLDVGCGHGTILGYAKDYFSKVYGIEPSTVECEIARENRLEVECGFFDRRFAGQNFDAIICTQVMEHIEDIKDFLECIRVSLKMHGGVYVDVPNGEQIVRRGEYYNVFREHINYFSVQGLTKLFSNHGFRIIEVSEKHNKSQIALFATKEEEALLFDDRIRRDHNFLKRLIDAFEVLGIWGAGVKGRIYASHIYDLNSKGQVKYIFDSDESLNGLYIGGCDIPICMPDLKLINECDCIIISAVEFEKEIKGILKEKYNYKKRIVTINDSV